MEFPSWRNFDESYPMNIHVKLPAKNLGIQNIDGKVLMLNMNKTYYPQCHATQMVAF